VLDLGAHHGVYTLLACKRVGASGMVIAFEPSRRERERLRRHLRVNRCSNARIAPYALSERAGEADLFLVEGEHDCAIACACPTWTSRRSAFGWRGGGWTKYWSGWRFAGGFREAERRGGGA
jgi:hypothetical protein